MINCTGDMWSAWGKVDLFLITTNSTVVNQRLVMGRGIAREARDHFPGLDYEIGKHIQKDYGLLVSPHWPEKKLGCFQVKYHWRNPAYLSIIVLSTVMLDVWCQEHPGAKVALNFPGIGNGRLAVEDVLLVIKHLPDTVQVWRRT